MTDFVECGIRSILKSDRSILSPRMFRNGYLDLSKPPRRRQGPDPRPL